MNSKYRCLKCGGADFRVSSTVWTCRDCRRSYPCVLGIPNLCLDEAIGTHDRALRDKFYDGAFGAFYGFLMPFIVLPVRPFAEARRHWALYGVAVGVMALLAALPVWLAWRQHWGAAVAPAVLFAALALLLRRQKYLFDLFVLAVPTKLSLAARPFQPAETFAQAHKRAMASLPSTNRRLQILDVSTGSCNSLYKHGWMDLDADYTALDLSATMLRVGQERMAARSVPVDLVLGDALNLPFQDEAFDIVLNYGAVNGMTDPGKALAEMARVAKPGGLILFLDEQMHPGATPVQGRYFHRVLSSHNVIHHCPVELLPRCLQDVRVSQVYEFYYICTARKRGAQA